MIFPIEHLMDEQKCYEWLLDFFHNGQLSCPTCGGGHYHAHKNYRKPITQFRCGDCGTFFNIFTATAFAATRWPCPTIVMILRGFLKGDSTLSISKELGLGYRNLLYLRHELMENAHFSRTSDLLPDSVTESDEVYQNAGEKGIPHLDEDDPPRRRANKKKDLAPGTTTDRPSMALSGGRADKYASNSFTIPHRYRLSARSASTGASKAPAIVTRAMPTTGWARI